MGMISGIFTTLFGSGRNLVVETTEAFRQNTEARGVRDAAHRASVVQQYAAEVATARPGLFDRAIDGLNRLPRPLMAFGTLFLIGTAMIDPVWFASRMQGLALVPEPLWWLMGAIVSFYFGARMQSHGQAFRRSIAETMAQVPQVSDNLRRLEALRQPEIRRPAPARPLDAPIESANGEPNAALEDWRRTQP